MSRFEDAYLNRQREMDEIHAERQRRRAIVADLWNGRPDGTRVAEIFTSAEDQAAMAEFLPVADRHGFWANGKALRVLKRRRGRKRPATVWSGQGLWLGDFRIGYPSPNWETSTEDQNALADGFLFLCDDHLLRVGNSWAVTKAPVGDWYGRGRGSLDRTLEAIAEAGGHVQGTPGVPSP